MDGQKIHGWKKREKGVGLPFKWTIWMEMDMDEMYMDGNGCCVIIFFVRIGAEVKRPRTSKL